MVWGGRVVFRDVQTVTVNSSWLKPLTTTA
jgi:hypothetical protein